MTEVLDNARNARKFGAQYGGIMMKTLGNAIPLIIVFAACFVLIWLIVRMRRDGQNNHYDEMQLAIRAKGYKMGFFVMLVGLFFVIFLMECTDVFQRMINPSFALGIVGFAGIVTFAVYCILNDAFYSIGQNRRTYIILCLIVILSNGIGMTGSIMEWTTSGEKTLSFDNSSSLLCCISFLIILIALLAKEKLDSKEEVLE